MEKFSERLATTATVRRRQNRPDRDTRGVSKSRLRRKIGALRSFVNLRKISAVISAAHLVDHPVHKVVEERVVFAAAVVVG